jgi:hypothetical protein
MKKKVILSILMISLLLVGCGSSSDKMVSKMTKFSKDISIDDDSTLNWKKYCLKSGDVACIDSDYKKDTLYVVKDIDDNGIPEILCSKTDSKGNQVSEFVSFYDFEYENDSANKNYSKDTQFDITKPSHNVISSGNYGYFGSNYDFFIVDCNENDMSSAYKVTYYCNYPILVDEERYTTQFIKDTKTGLWSGNDFRGNSYTDCSFDELFEYPVDWVNGNSEYDADLVRCGIVDSTFSISSAYSYYSDYNSLYDALLNGTW